MLFLSVQELELRKIVFDTDFPAGEIDYSQEGVRQTSALHVEGTAELLHNTLGEIRISGQLKVDLEMQCDRCLDPVYHTVAGPFDLFYRPTPRGPLPHEVAIDEGESQIGFYSGGGIELSDVLREHILLSLPMHQICRDNCAGICPKCGQNKNSGTCTCTEEVVDDRWAALRDLRENLRTGS